MKLLLLFFPLTPIVRSDIYSLFKLPLVNFFFANLEFGFLDVILDEAVGLPYFFMIDLMSS
jgi:hypothetical protein